MLVFGMTDRNTKYVLELKIDEELTEWLDELSCVLRDIFSNGTASNSNNIQSQRYSFVRSISIINFGEVMFCYSSDHVCISSLSLAHAHNLSCYRLRH